MESPIKKFLLEPVSIYLGATIQDPVKQVGDVIFEEEAKPLKRARKRFSDIQKAGVSPDVNYQIREIRPSSSGRSCLNRGF